MEESTNKKADIQTGVESSNEPSSLSRVNPKISLPQRTQAQVVTTEFEIEGIKNQISELDQEIKVIKYCITLHEAKTLGVQIRIERPVGADQLTLMYGAYETSQLITEKIKLQEQKTLLMSKSQNDLVNTRINSFFELQTNYHHNNWFVAAFPCIVNSSLICA